MPPPSANEPTTVTPSLLRSWPLPEANGGKEGRGRTLIIGGSRETPGAVLLAAEAALRSGAGKLQVATAASVAAALAVALPEALVCSVAETSTGALDAQDPRGLDHIHELAAAADCVLVGPGLADAEQSAQLLRSVVEGLGTPVVVDALALAAVTEDVTCLHHLDGQLVLTPNPGELAYTMHTEPGVVEADPLGQARLLTGQAKAVVSLGGETSWIVSPDGRTWCDPSGAAGLGVSGSGDVRAGIVAGLVARGCGPEQAAVWAAHLHGRAGERLASTIGRLGFLARELPRQIPAVLAEIEQ